MKVLLIEDDLELCSSIEEELVKNGHVVDSCNDGESAMLYALNKDYAYDLAVVDRMLPVIDGLDGGADDYLVKLFHIRELLHILMQKPEHLFTREQLVLKIWGTSSDVEPDINWRRKMLKKLSNKLHLIFISSLMLIIGIVCMNYIRGKRHNDSAFFQRLSTLLIFRIEGGGPDLEAEIKEYEDNYSIYCVLTDLNSKIIYQSDLSFPTDQSTLLENFKAETETQQSNDLVPQKTTVQNGIFKVAGNSHDKYWGIPAEIVSKDENGYHLILLYRQKSGFELLKNQIPFYFLIWSFSFVCIVMVSHLLLKKALEPTERILKSQYRR